MALARMAIDPAGPAPGLFEAEDDAGRRRAECGRPTRRDTALFEDEGCQGLRCSLILRAVGGAAEDQPDKRRVYVRGEQAAETPAGRGAVAVSSWAPAYLLARGISDAAARDWGIGYAPAGWTALTDQ